MPKYFTHYIATYNIGVAAFPIFVRTRLPNCMKGIVDGNFRVEIYVHLLDLTRTNARNANLGPWQELNLRPCDSV